MALDKYNEVLPTRLRYLIDQSGQTQNAVASAVGVSRQSISQYCDGSSIPNADKLLKIAEFFHISADYLLGLSDAPTNNKDEEFISDKTGLSVEAVRFLCDESISGSVVSVINTTVPTAHMTLFFSAIFDYLNSSFAKLYANMDTFDLSIYSQAKARLECGQADDEDKALVAKFEESETEGFTIETKTDGICGMIGHAHSRSVNDSFLEPYFMMSVQNELKNIKEELKRKATS